MISLDFEEELGVKPEVKAMLEAQAEAQGRTLTNYLEWIARQHSQPVQ